jgi:hypothetical protein
LSFSLITVTDATFLIGETVADVSSFVIEHKTVAIGGVTD